MKAGIRSIIVAVLFSLFAVNLTAGPWYWINIPHVAFGGGYTSYLTISDPHGISSRQVYVYLYDDNGSPLVATVEGFGQVSQFVFNLSAFQEKSFALTGTGSTKSGQVEISAEGIGRINASVRFISADASANVTDAVGILPVPPNNNWTVAVDTRKSTEYLGVAIANWWDSSITVLLDLYQGGSRAPGTGTLARTLSPHGHLAVFAHQLFPGFNGIGTLRISCASNPFTAVALRADGLQYSSLSADAGTQFWNWTYTNLSGAQNGSWSWRFTERDSFLGWETNPSWNYGVFLRGQLDTSFFIAEWKVDYGDGTVGTVLFQGTPTRESGNDVINGTRLSLKSDGSIDSSHPFKATRVY